MFSQHIIARPEHVFSAELHGKKLNFSNVIIFAPSYDEALVTLVQKLPYGTLCKNDLLYLTQQDTFCRGYFWHAKKRAFIEH